MSRNLPKKRGPVTPGNVTPLQLYLREIAKHPLLSPEEELSFAKQHFDDGDIRAAHRLVTSNLRLVVKIANEFRQAQINFLDLIQEGNSGLMQAVKRFNPYKGVKLSSYAAWWVRAYILKYIMDNKSHVKIGTTAAQRKLFFNLKKEADKMMQDIDKVDTKRLADSLNVKEKEVIDMQVRLGFPDLFLDAPVSGGGEGGGSHGALLADGGEAIDESLARVQMRKVFGEHLEEFRGLLKGRDLEIFKLRMLAEKPVTLQQIGDTYGISRERARQLEAKILSKLRDFVKEKGIIDLPSS